MTSKEIEFVDLTNQQYEALIKMQMESYKKILDFCRENISDSEKVEIIDKNLLKMDEKIITKLEEMRVYNKIFMETVK
ncbi:MULTISPECIES: hypothetical protein [Clostridium]|jgi:hypothetical protein|uniref:Uncharacterized protein n=2 Tax=Clostridium beijerinckii TaxID=1520 RepID=A0AAE2RVN7_CLOBE|nr:MULTISPECIES: hypothetical protein [Clostridium]ABR34345.1 hypothetical protein Cbei_2178 [Clostridium beijerinckii NCIMB 8052]AIU04946.1 hypothetical protein Cbs_2178 [Clostridium beijerinckii ATCC 35702]MBF7811041.1 hypothetical protein [Clostridium beijerinckii]NRT24345.1 precorrin-3B methylase [Clostridium beijerinckii]NRT68064.1 precorrin-3B methylase [Clostridium beijerinckii]